MEDKEFESGREEEEFSTEAEEEVNEDNTPTPKPTFPEDKKTRRTSSRTKKNAKTTPKAQKRKAADTPTGKPSKKMATDATLKYVVDALKDLQQNQVRKEGLKEVVNEAMGEKVKGLEKRQDRMERRLDATKVKTQQR